MGRGDLNNKKSWHPLIERNQRRVWEEEKKALDERKNIEKLRKEREEERALEALQKLQEEHGGRKRVTRVDWLYSGPSDGQPVSEEAEAYLLGKRRVDSLLKSSSETKSLQKGADAPLEVSSNVNSVRDTASKISNDPLMIIKKQQMEAQLKALKEAQTTASKRERKDKDKHRHRSGRDDRDGHRSRRHRDSDSRSRSRSPRRRRRHRSPDLRLRSRSPYERRSRDHRYRSPSPRRSYKRSSAEARSRSRSPYEGRPYDRRRSRSPYQRRHRSRSPRRSSDVPRRAPSPRRDEKASGPSAAEKLAMMQADAAAVEQDRKDRVDKQAEQDKVEEEALRNRKKDGGQRFVADLHRKSATDISSRMGRSRGVHVGEGF